MAKKRGKTASRVLTVIMVMALLFVASGNVFISASAAGNLGTTIYLKTDKTQSPYIHYWDSKSEGSAWPGVAMTKVDGETDIYSYDLPFDISNLAGVIFLSDGSGSKMTDDVTNITGNLYTLSSNSWSTYDTSPLKIKEFTVDPEGPQFTGSTIALSAAAEGGDGIQYKFSVSGAKDEVISDFSSKTSASWVPTVAGSYTVKLEVKDSAGNTNSRSVDYVIKDLKDAENAEEPVFLSASPANNSQIKKGGTTTVTVNGTGGKVNNNLLFYKTEVIDPNGQTVNTAYYQLGNKLSFDATLLGTYTVKMYIQNNTVKNTTVVSTYTYSSVENPEESDVDSESDVISDSDTETETETAIDSDSESDVISDTDTETETESEVISDTETETETEIETETETESETTTDTQTDTQTGSQSDSDTSTDESDTDTESDTNQKPVKGDFDGNGKVKLDDVYSVQAAALGKVDVTPEQFSRLDVNGDGKITLKDASLIQQAVAGIVDLDKR